MSGLGIRLSGFSIRQKMVLISLVSGITALLISGSALVMFQHNTHYTYYQKDLNSITRILAANLEAAVAFRDATDAITILNTLKKRQDVTAAAVFDDDKVILAQWSLPGTEKISEGSIPECGTTKTDLGFVSCAVIQSSGNIKARLVIRTSSARVDTSVMRSLTAVSATILIAAILTFFMISRLQKIIFEPIYRLQSGMQEIAVSKDYSKRVARNSSDELGQLTDYFNELLIQTEKNISAIKDAEDRFSKAFYLSPDAVAISYQQTDKLLDINYGFERMFGYSRDEALGGTIESMHVIADLEDKRKMRYLLDQEGFIRGLEIKAMDKSGVLFDAEITSAKITIHQENCILSIIRNISERKKSEQELARQERKYREIFNAGLDAIYIHELETGIVVDVNEPMLKMFACERRDVLGHTIEKFSAGYHPYTVENALQKIKRAVQQGPQTFEWRARKLTGELFWVEVHLRASHIDDEHRILAVVRDITERKRSQEMIIQSEKMLSVGGLAAGMAHEINNPLAGMMQSAQNLTSRLTNEALGANRRAAQQVDLDLSKMKSYMELRSIPRMLKAINDSGIRIAGIVNNILSFARKNENFISSHKIEELLDKSLELASTDYDLKKKYDFKNIRIVKEYEENLPMVPCEEGKMQQVFINILRNGAQAMAEYFSMRKDFVESGNGPQFILRVMKQADRIRVVIEDNGPGMTEEIKSRIFEPFYTTKPVGSGTGLGLSLSYFIITENHYGEMSVESQPGRGAKFIIKLPMQRSLKI